jgi:V/A-type H+-transporting ATPase subunit I
MIVRMAKIRVLGPRDLLDSVFKALQELGVLELVEPDPGGPVERMGLTEGQRARHRRFHRILADIEACLDSFGHIPHPAFSGPASREDLARWARLARRLRPQVEHLRATAADLEEEEALLLKYRPFLTTFGRLLKSESTWKHAAAYHVVIAREDGHTVPKLREALREVVGEEFELRSEHLPTGEVALLILITSPVAERVEQMLKNARVQDIPVPSSYGAHSLAEAVPRMLERLEQLAGEIAEIEGRIAELAARHRDELARARDAFIDCLSELDALPAAGATRHAFVVEGWAPVEELPRLCARLEREFAPLVVVEEVCRDGPSAAEAPVVLRNPRLVRPFESLLRLLAPPRYGSVDPTPFVAVFFPLFFGLMVGDVAYGLVMIPLALLLRSRTRPGSVFRAVSEVAGVCAASAIVFGILYGEFLGGMGHEWFGMRPLAFNRETALTVFLVVAVALGFIHVVLGLVLGTVSEWRYHRRHALAKGATAAIIVLAAVLLLGVLGFLPKAAILPGAVMLALCLPLLVVTAGFMGIIEILSTMSNVMSYARLMALGTAGVMLADVANELAGAVGLLILGVVVGLFFHTLNFVITVFSPTIHALRLHYVEFFGKFYDPGGRPFRPFARFDQQLGR